MPKYQAFCVTPETTFSVMFNVPKGHENPNEIWEFARKYMAQHWGFTDVTCWERIKG